MKHKYTLAAVIFTACLPVTVSAGWFDSEEEKKRERAGIIVSECVELIQEDYDKKKHADSKVTVEVFAGDIKILSEDVVLTEIIVLSSTTNYISKQEKEGICRFIPESENIAWQPFAL